MLVADDEGEMISFSSDDELLEVVGHVTDGVLRVYVELADSHRASSANHFHPHQFIGAMSGLMPGLTNSGRPSDTDSDR